jgi:putative addiction module component (TIGR02574 family)
MASQIMERLLKEALGLPKSERAEMARNLVRSLDGPADATAADDWDQEIVRRIEQIDAGTAQTIDRKEFGRRLKERVGRA